MIIKSISYQAPRFPASQGIYNGNIDSISRYRINEGSREVVLKNNIFIIYYIYLYSINSFPAYREAAGKLTAAA